MLPLLLTSRATKVGDPLAFYEVAATVLPVIFVALLYQANVMEQSPFDVAPFFLKDAAKLRRRSTLIAVAMTAWVFTVSMAGEIVAFGVLASRRPNSGAAALIGLALYSGGIVLLMQRTLLALRNSDFHRSALEGEDFAAKRHAWRQRTLVILVFSGMLIVGLITIPIVATLAGAS